MCKVWMDKEKKKKTGSVRLVAKKRPKDSSRKTPVAVDAFSEWWKEEK